MIQSYSENCDYLRNKFNLGIHVGLYEMIQIVTDFIKGIEDKEQIEQISNETKENKQTVEESAKESAEPISITKEKKRGRPRK